MLTKAWPASLIQYLKYWWPFMFRGYSWLLPSELIPINSLELSGHLEQARVSLVFNYLSCLLCLTESSVCPWILLQRCSSLLMVRKRVEEGDCTGRKQKSPWRRIETTEKQKLLLLSFIAGKEITSSFYELSTVTISMQLESCSCSCLISNWFK